MKALALDTTTRVGSVALVADERIVDERIGDRTRTHAERLPRELIDVAEANGVALSNVDLFAVAAGPGSFTGLRIGIATVQGLAFVHRRLVVGISALEALAHAASLDATADTIVAVWIDAHRHEVFAALYRVAGAAPVFDDSRIVELDGPSVGDPEAVLTRWRAQDLPDPQMFVGDGATMYGEPIARHVAAARIVPAPMLAGAIGRLALRRARTGGAVDPAGIQPLYVRRPDVELVRDRSR